MYSNFQNTVPTLLLSLSLSIQESKIPSAMLGSPVSCPQVVKKSKIYSSELSVSLLVFWYSFSKLCSLEGLLEQIDFLSSMRNPLNLLYWEDFMRFLLSLDGSSVLKCDKCNWLSVHYPFTCIWNRAEVWIIAESKWKKTGRREFCVNHPP